MPNLDIALPHKLGRDEALRRIKKRLEEEKEIKSIIQEKAKSLLE